MFIYQKEIDRSTLRQGFQITKEFHHLLKLMPGGMPMRGETRKIRILLDGVEYDAELKNQSFDETKFKDHTDVIQVRYSVGNPLSKRLREIFSSTWQYVEQIKNLPENRARKLTIKVPDERREYLVLSCTEIPDQFMIECITADWKADVNREICSMPELEFETFEPRVDPKARIEKMTRLQKVRLLDRSIGDSLKSLYDFRCQMTGERVGEDYDALVVEAHHIIPFTESMNNDSSNIIILSPSYHRIVHKAKPSFDRTRLAFCFPNGLVEQVKLNEHLK